VSAEPAAGRGAGGLGASARLVGTLVVAGLLSGLAIVSTYRITLPTIQANQAAELERAVFEVLPGARRMTRLVWAENRLAPAATGAGSAEDSIFAGYAADGGLVGYAVPAAGAGFQDTIKLIYGLDPTGVKIIGMKVLESRETPGLGDRIAKDEKFHAEFTDLAVEPTIHLVKGHGEAANDVDAITGATISSRAVVKILNTADALWRPRLPAPGTAPPGAEQSPKAAVPADVERGGPVPAVPAGGHP
jgi:electron transport complex protein RnfG